MRKEKEGKRTIKKGDFCNSVNAQHHEYIPTACIPSKKDTLQERWSAYLE
jgi:hypothetical protein